MEEDTEDEEALLEPEAEPELEPVPEVSNEDRDVHSQNCRREGSGNGDGDREEHGKCVYCELMELVCVLSFTVVTDVIVHSGPPIYDRIK